MPGRSVQVHSHRQEHWVSDNVLSMIGISLRVTKAVSSLPMVSISVSTNVYMVIGRRELDNWGASQNRLRLERIKRK